MLPSKISTGLCIASRAQVRRYSSSPSLTVSPFAPRHLLSIADLSSKEFVTLVKNGLRSKQAWKSGAAPSHLLGALSGKTVAILFSKRSTRTRVSTEGAVAAMGGHPMFLGANDIQLGVNETLYDTSVVISSMVSCIVARVHAHSDVAGIAKSSSVPVINALSDSFHPLQCIADYITIHESIPGAIARSTESSLGLDGLKISWVGDANNVFYDLAIAAAKLGINISIATPKGYEVPQNMRELILGARNGSKTQTWFEETNVPEEAVKDADVIVTDTWISMGQEGEAKQKLKAFEGFQVTQELAKRGGAKDHWQFMHCLPRHPEEVSDEVFYGRRSLVFPEAENRLWAAISALESFIVRKGQIE